MRRHEWFAKLAYETVGMLPSARKQFLTAIPGLATPADPFETPLLGHAALVAHLCARYDTAHSANDATARLVAAGLVPPGSAPHEVLDELVRPTFSALREGRIPLDDWWSPADLDALVFGWYARWKLVEIGEPELRAELTERWALTEAARDAFVSQARRALPIVPDLLRAPLPGTTRDALWRDEALQTALGEEVGQLSDRARLHQDLWDMAVAGARYRVLAVAAATGGSDEGPELGNALPRAGDQLLEALEGLTRYEIQQLTDEASDDERLLRAAVDARRNVAEISVAGVNAPADGYGLALRVPEWLTEYIFARGGRIGHRSLGPIPYWYVVVEGTEVPDELSNEVEQPGVTLAEVESAGLMELMLVHHVRGQPRHAPFYFGRNVDDAMELALLALAGFVRIDIFRLGEDGLLELLHSGRYPVANSQLAANVREHSLDFLRAHKADPDALLGTWLQAAVDENPAAGFVASDWAKSEELLELEVVPDRPEATEAQVNAYRAARGALLSLQGERARRLLRTTNVEDLDESVREAREEYRFVSAELGPPASRREGDDARVRDLTAGLVDETHAFLHLNIGETRYLEGFVCHAKNGVPRVERLDLGFTPLGAIDSAFRAWEDGERDSVTRVVDAAGQDLGQDLADALWRAGAEHAIISPLAWLHAFPFALLPLRDGRLLGDVFSLSYAPSARVLQRLRSQRSDDGVGVAALAYHSEDDIPWTSAEVAAVGLLHEQAEVFDGPTATPQTFLGAGRRARFLHAACHGSWRLNDYFASGLHLAPADSPEDGYLSVAGIHRDGDFRNVDVVVLSACDSGRSAIRWPAVETYTGIDGAFLARGASTVVSSLWEVGDFAGLLFSTALHTRLAEGSLLRDAFAYATGMLRRGGFRDLEGGREVDVLDETAPGWREVLDHLGEHLTHPYYWGVFKLSGLVAEVGGPPSERSPHEAERPPGKEQP